MFLYAQGNLYNLDQVEAVLSNDRDRTVELWGADPDTAIARIGVSNPAKTVKDIAQMMADDSLSVAHVNGGGEVSPLAR